MSSEKATTFLKITDPEAYKKAKEIERKKQRFQFPKLESNRVGPWNEKAQDYDYVARMYSGYTKDAHRVVEADGSYYKGSIKTRKVSRKRINGDGNFWQNYYELGDGRWFDNSGMLCEKPKSKIAGDNEPEEPVDTNEQGV
jgi:hypothetical protein